MNVLKHILASLALIILFPVFLVIGIVVGLFGVSDMMTGFYYELVGNPNHA